MKLHGACLRWDSTTTRFLQHYSVSPCSLQELLHGDSAAPLRWAISSAHPSTYGLVVLSSMRVSHIKQECSAGQQMRKSGLPDAYFLDRENGMTSGVSKAARAWLPQKRTARVNLTGPCDSTANTSLLRPRDPGPYTHIQSRQECAALCPACTARLRQSACRLGQTAHSGPDPSFGL